jgi:hypothetical protein
MTFSAAVRPFGLITTVFTAKIELWIDPDQAIDFRLPTLRGPNATIGPAGLSAPVEHSKTHARARTARADATLRHTAPATGPYF